MRERSEAMLLVERSERNERSSQMTDLNDTRRV